VLPSKSKLLSLRNKKGGERERERDELKGGKWGGMSLSMEFKEKRRRGSMGRRRGVSGPSNAFN